jgi:hypothetical protein
MVEVEEDNWEDEQVNGSWLLVGHESRELENSYW